MRRPPKIPFFFFFFFLAAAGKRSLNPSMPLCRAQPKVRLIPSTGKHQMLPCSLASPLRCLVASEGSPLTRADVTAHTRGKNVQPLPAVSPLNKDRWCLLFSHGYFWEDWLFSLSDAAEGPEGVKDVKLRPTGGDVPKSRAKRRVSGRFN